MAIRRDQALGMVRLMLEGGISVEEAVSNPAIPIEYRQWILEQIQREENIKLEPVRVLSAGAPSEWYHVVDRGGWYYWPTLRTFLLGHGWSEAAVRSLDDTTDRIMERIPPPDQDNFDVRGLVLGYVQSGKTSNYTGLIAKAADCGYRLFIVLSGIDKGLRLQTQIRLNRELMGYRYPGYLGDLDQVPVPPVGKQWVSFTTEEPDGDFDSGHVNQAVLQGYGPILMVIKKNSRVLGRLIRWLDGAAGPSFHQIPAIVIDDEADLASIDTRGSYITQDDPLPDDYEPPSVINGHIRDLLKRFSRKVYVAYTATPFANILIPYDVYDPYVQNDLYPKDFIIDIPKPSGYFGAEELFEIEEADGNYITRGIDVMRPVPDEDVQNLREGRPAQSLEQAILGYILAGAARLQRGQDGPSTMLIHVDRRIETHSNVADLVRNIVSDFKSDIRYHTEQSSEPEVIASLRSIWNTDFRPQIKEYYPQYDVEFDALEPHIRRFIESVQIRIINSATGQILDFKREPHLKAICIGGDRLSRGLTLEGLVTSYFVRDTPYYDTLMQMGRWFGFREGYIDLTRIWTTRTLADHFALLALVEHQLRQDLRIYEDMQLTPQQVGIRILKHPSMQVTAPMKRRHARDILINQSYSGQLVQTFKFPFDRPDELAQQQDNNQKVLKDLIGSLGSPTKWFKSRPIWENVDADVILDFIDRFSISDFPERAGFSKDPILSYIRARVRSGELVRWTVAIMGLVSPDPDLGTTSWKVDGRGINMISRSRIRQTNSLGVVTSPGDEIVGLDEDEMEKFDEAAENREGRSRNETSRYVRSPKRGLLLIYPISGRSRPADTKKNRVQLFEENDPHRRDLIALAISFPNSEVEDGVPVQYVTNILGWRSYDEGE
ncbi:Z1 domain-containing protein [Caldiplasma sukawensis]